MTTAPSLRVGIIGYGVMGKAVLCEKPLALNYPLALRRQPGRDP